MDTANTVRAAVFSFLLVASVFLILHERHYRSRRERIIEARTGGTGALWDSMFHGLDRRLTVLEEIIMEERDS